MNSKLDIVIDGSVFFQQVQGGITRMYNEILPRMCIEDESLQIILIIQDKKLPSLPRHRNIAYLTVPALKSYMVPAFFWKQAIGLNRYFLINQKARTLKNPIWHSTYFTTAGKWKGSSVVTVHDMIYERFPNIFNTPRDQIFRNSKRKCIEEADAIICNSETTRKDLAAWYKCTGKAITVIPLAYSSSFRKLNDNQDGSEEQKKNPFILYVGSRAAHKNFASLLQGYSKWSLAREIDLFVIGKSWTEDEQRLLTNLGIEDQVYLVSNCCDDELCKFYNQAIAFVYPSLFEGFGIPLLEAMACECPIVASHIPSTIEVAGDYPFYFEPTNLESLEEALNQAVFKGMESSRILYGRDRLKHYSWDKTAKETLNVYCSL